MGTIALSYRRDDTEAVTGRLFDRLAAHFGRDAVFRDIETFAVGSDYRVQAEAALKRSRVLLAIIGRRWRGGGRAGGSARIEDADDPVRVELEIALRHGVPIIPVLVGGARMPGAAQVPETIRPVLYQQACRVDPGLDFDHHADRLVREVDRLLGRDHAAAPAEPGPSPGGPTGRYGVSLRGEGASRLAEVAPAEWGGYARGSVSDYPGTYLVIRPTFRTPGNVYTYLLDMSWDERDGGLVFQERNRPDARHSQSGRVWIPNGSVHLYLVSGRDGWLRSLTLSFLNGDEEMSGLISTLHNVGGASFVPVAAPILLQRREALDDDAFGEITPQSTHHARYSAALRRAAQNGAARLISL